MDGYKTVLNPLSRKRNYNKMKEMISSDNSILIGVLGGVAAIITSFKWIADSLKEWRMGREIKLEEIMKKLEIERERNKSNEMELQVIKNDLQRIKITMSAVLPLLRKMNAGDIETLNLLSLFEEERKQSDT
jgi:ATP-dependent protease HslVU (ClpYQ) peptidase subunit